MAMPEYCLEQSHEILLLFPNDLYIVCPYAATTTTLTGGHYEAPVPVSVVRMRGPMMEIVPRCATTAKQIGSGSVRWFQIGRVIF